MIAKFFMYLPFELFITDEEHFGMQGEFLDGPWFGTRFVIPIAWAYTERPDPDGDYPRHYVQMGLCNDSASF